MSNVKETLSSAAQRWCEKPVPDLPDPMMALSDAGRDAGPRTWRWRLVLPTVLALAATGAALAVLLGDRSPDDRLQMTPVSSSAGEPASTTAPIAPNVLPERVVWAIDSVRTSDGTAAPAGMVSALWMDEDALVVVDDCVTVNGRYNIDASTLAIGGIEPDAGRCRRATTPTSPTTNPQSALQAASPLIDALRLARSYRATETRLELIDRSGVVVLAAHAETLPAELQGTHRITSITAPDGSVLEPTEYALSLTQPTNADFSGGCGDGLLRMFIIEDRIVFYESIFEAMGCPDNVSETFGLVVTDVRTWRATADTIELLDSAASVLITLAR